MACPVVDLTSLFMSVATECQFPRIVPAAGRALKLWLCMFVFSCRGHACGMKPPWRSTQSSINYHHRICARPKCWQWPYYNRWATNAGNFLCCCTWCSYSHWVLWIVRAFVYLWELLCLYFVPLLSAFFFWMSSVRRLQHDTLSNYFVVTCCRAALHSCFWTFRM